MGTITIGQRSFATPVLVPSISSFETQLKPIDALRLQHALQEPISLVSAYDVWRDQPDLTSVCNSFRERGILLMDSGGYESSRISHYADETRETRWDFDKYRQVAEEDVYDFIFSYDYFLEKEETAAAFNKRLVQELEAHRNILDIRKLIPVVHVRTVDASRRLHDEEIIDLFEHVAASLKSTFIAVPERELGDGIVSRAELTRKICEKIKSAGSCSLHILGCGNLLSYSLLAVAGAKMCDGLEWCRTLAAENFHLHHFQQKDLFAGPPIPSDLDYPTSVAVRNLFSFQNFGRDLHTQLQQHRVHEFVERHFGAIAGAAIRKIEQ